MRIEWGTKKAFEKCPKHEEFERICSDILAKIKNTNQTYIVGHDIPLSISQGIPLSISQGLFNLLDESRKMWAQRMGVPEVQFEFEDIIALLIGINIRAEPYYLKCPDDNTKLPLTEKQLVWLLNHSNIQDRNDIFEIHKEGEDECLLDYAINKLREKSS